MKSIWIAVLLAVNAIIVDAQFELTGTVEDDSGQAMIGANVYIGKTFQGATTDLNGRYSIRNLPAGNYEISASYMGYETGLKNIDLQGDMELSFILAPRVEND